MRVLTGLDGQEAAIDIAMSEQEALLAKIDPQLIELSRSGNISVDSVIPIVKRNFYLAFTVGKRTLKLIEAFSNGNFSSRQRLDVHHTFFTPTMGIALAAYDPTYGTIAIISPVSSR